MKLSFSGVRKYWSNTCKSKREKKIVDTASFIICKKNALFDTKRLGIYTVHLFNEPIIMTSRYYTHLALTLYYV